MSCFRQVAVIDASTMVRGIPQPFGRAGLQVALYDCYRRAVEFPMRQIRRNFDAWSAIIL